MQPDGGHFRWLGNCRCHICARRDGGPLTANYLEQTRCLRWKLGRVAEIGVISPVAGGWVINIRLAPNIGGIEAREHLDHRTIVGEYVGQSPGFQKTREVFHAAAVVSQGRLDGAGQKGGVDGGG